MIIDVSRATAPADFAGLHLQVTNSLFGPHAALCGKELLILVKPAGRAKFCVQDLSCRAGQ